MQRCDSWEELKEKIDLFLLGLRHPVLTEPGGVVLDLSASSYSLSTEYGKLLWHVWNEETNLVRQITAIQKERPGRMELRYQKFGKGPPGTLVLAESRAASERLGRRSERARYARTLRTILAQLFPGWKVERLTSEPDLQHSFSGLYARGMLRRGQSAWAVMGVGEAEGPEAAAGILTYGLLWMDWLRREERAAVIEGLKVFVPPGKAGITVERLAWMEPKAAKWEVYETGEETLPADLCTIGNFRTALGPVPVLPALPAPVMDAVAQITALSPLIEQRPARDGSLAMELQGMPFARASLEGVLFGVGREEKILGGGNWSELNRLVEKLLRLRHADSEDPLHPYYRLQPERWLQSIVMEQVQRLGCGLIPDAVYSQVPSLSGTERGLVDLLAITEQGRLAVLELKVSEDIHLPLQALDYWMRVRWHQQRGDFARQGYFRGREIGDLAPLLLLVAPALQFHPACETVLRYFSPAVEVVRIGISENWREHLSVVYRPSR